MWLQHSLPQSLCLQNKIPVSHRGPQVFCDPSSNMLVSHSLYHPWPATHRPCCEGFTLQGPAVAWPPVCCFLPWCQRKGFCFLKALHNLYTPVLHIAHSILIVPVSSFGGFIHFSLSFQGIGKWLILGHLPTTLLEEMATALYSHSCLYVVPD